MSESPEPEAGQPPSRAFLPYPASTLSPRIVPNDLSTYKARGISQVERDLHQKLVELRESYVSAVEHFNWNKLIYEAEINFEPVVGQTYHLYEIRDRFALSMIGPAEWPQRHIGSFRLNVGRQWEPVEIAEDVDPAVLFG
ncbi:MAG: DUF2452 domain-containing protein [Akkermansiaceae bacterium]|nr:DUF2452 domain-containing protein [Akkermansiaceae bacterium]